MASYRVKPQIFMDAADLDAADLDAADLDAADLDAADCHGYRRILINSRFPCSDLAETTHDASRLFKAIDFARLYFLPGYGAGRQALPC
jgi:hypothetical protein